MCLWLCLSPEVAVRCVRGCVCHLKWRSGVFRGCVCHLKWRSGVFVAVFVT